jgi:hypothetical protein
LVIIGSFQIGRAERLHSNANFSYWLDYKWDASFARKETRRLAGSEESVFKTDSTLENGKILSFQN